MSKKIRCAALLARMAVLAWTAGSTVALAAQATDCVENGGQMECTGPQIVSTRYDMCDEAGTFLYLANIKNRCGWGTISGDDDIVSKAQCYSDAVTGCNGSAVDAPAWSTPGQSYTSWLCWSITTTVRNGIEVLNFARLTGSAIYRDSVTQSCSASGGLPYGIVAMRWRDLGCQDGWTQYSVPGGYQCRRPIQTSPPLSTAGADNGSSCPAEGNPIFAGTGNKYQREQDYTGPGLLAFVRHYNSSNGAWTHSYAMRVQPVDATGTVRVLRPDGKEFIFTGSGVGAWSSNPTVVERLEQLPAGDPSGALWRVTDAQDTVESYGANGLPLSITYRGGQILRLQYSNAQLAGVTDDFGRSLSFTTDAQGRITSLTVPGGLTTAYTWGTNGLLSQVRYPDQTSRQYLYESSSFPKALTGIVDENGVRYASFAYDGLGRAISTEHAGGTQRYQLSYADPQPVVTEPLGGQRTMQFTTVSGRKIYAGQNRPSSIPQGDVNGKQIDPVSGLVTAATDFLGVNTLFTWDVTRKLPTSTTWAAARPEAQTAQTQWHPIWRLPVLVSEAGRSTAYHYDDAGNKLSETVTDTATGQARTWQWSYTPQGLVASMTDPKGASWTYGYDSAGNRTSVRNPLGQTTSYSYDSAGRMTGQTEPNGLLTTYAWDARSRLIQTNRGGEVSTFTYTPSGQFASAVQPNGYTVSYGYDAAQRLIGANDNLGSSIQYSLDAMGNRVAEQVKDANGNIALATSRVINSLNQVAAVQGAQLQTTAFTYNANGQATSSTDPLQQTTRQTLDALGRSTATTFADNSSAQQDWNQLNQLTGVTDPKSIATGYQRNVFGEVMAETSPDIGQLSYQRDANGKVTRQTDALGNTTVIDRDALGRPGIIQYSATQQARFTWDSDQAGYLARLEDNSGSVSYRRDNQGRILAKNQQVNDNPSFPGQFQVRYGYGDGDLASINYPSGLQVSYRRSSGRITGIDVQPPGKDPLPFVSDLTHTALGQPGSWAWRSGDSAQRSFDADGRMTTSEIASYSYDAASRLTGITQKLWSQDSVTGQLSQLPITWQAGYDRRNRLVSFTRAGAASQYSYDANSNRLSAVESIDQGGDIDASLDKDNFSQSLNQALNIDPTSNRLLGFTQTVTQTRGGNALNQTSATVSYGLDAAGNLTSDGLRTFEYDAAGRLSKVKLNKDGEQAGVSYLHNALGQRVFKSEVQASQTLPDETTLGQGFINWLRQGFGWLFQKNGQTTSLGQAYVYGDGEIPNWALLGEYDNGTASGKGRTEYIWLPSQDGAIPIGMYRNGKLYAIHADHLGTPRLITDETNRPVWQWAYSAFGANKPSGILQATMVNGQTMMKATKPNQEVNQRLPGQYFDEESNLNYNYFRSYDARVRGGYVQPDPIGLDGGINRFSYVGGKPLTRIDPTGLDFLVVTGGSRERSNPFGHTGVGVTGAGMYSYGNNTGLGSGPLSYITDQAQYRDQTITIIPRTPAQDQAALDNLSGNGCRNCVGILDNCAVRTDSALHAGGVNTGMWPFPGGVARDAMRAPGATTYYVPQGGSLPQGLVDALRPFNPPNVP